MNTPTRKQLWALIDRCDMWSRCPESIHPNRWKQLADHAVDGVDRLGTPDAMTADEYRTLCGRVGALWATDRIAL